MADEKNEFAHNVFISWSGNRSKHVAEALRDWLHLILHAARPWASSTDIDKGSRGIAEITRALENTKVGIICLTPENLSAKWILYEAGALSKTLGNRVCTYLLDLEPKDVSPPLGDFQATVANKEDTRLLVRTLNKGLDSPLTEQDLDVTFDLLWPRLESALTSVPEPETAIPPKRSLEDMVGEILEHTRTINARTTPSMNTFEITGSRLFDDAIRKKLFSDAFMETLTAINPEVKDRTYFNLFGKERNEQQAEKLQAMKALQEKKQKRKSGSQSRSGEKETIDRAGLNGMVVPDNTARVGIYVGVTETPSCAFPG